MVKQITAAVIISSAFLLAGCQQTAFGVSQKQFSAMTPKQKSQAIARYNLERKKTALTLPMHVVAGVENNDNKG